MTSVAMLYFKLHVLSFVRYGGPPRFGGGGGGSRGGPPPGKFGNPGERLRKKQWNLDELPKFQKNFYQEHPDTSRRPLVRPDSSSSSSLTFNKSNLLFCNPQSSEVF